MEQEASKKRNRLITVFPFVSMIIIFIMLVSSASVVSSDEGVKLAIIVSTLRDYLICFALVMLILNM